MKFLTSIVLAASIVGSVFAVIRLVELQPTCPSDVRYRTFDGYCNNLQNPTWGQAGTAQRRFTDVYGNPMVDYEDGVDLPRGGIPSRLPSPRLVTNLLSNSSLGPSNQTDTSRSGQSMAFGQFIAHDFIKTTIPTGTDCCDVDEAKYNDTNVCYTFNVPEDDTRLSPGCKSFIRSEKATSGGDLPAYREHKNDLSAFIDATFLYGSSESEIQALRVENSYLMKTGTDNTLPLMNGGGCVQFHSKCPLAGDSRVAEAPNLGLNHMLWVREHNRIAMKLDSLNPENTTTYTYMRNGTFYQETRDDIIFQETRRIIIAMVQHITYNHFLPAILEQGTMNSYNLYSTSTGYNDVYDATVDPSIRNGFGTAPFRYGHSQIMADQSLLHNDFETLNITPLEDTLKNPELYLLNNGTNIPNLARWLTFKPALQIDIFLVDGARDKLFMHSQSHPEDLYSLNIQRGRDQGTPGFNRWRQFCGLSNMTFDDFANFTEALTSLYQSPDDIDLFIGGLMEKGVDGGVGPTFACMIGKQFQLFKTGDRFWYERSDSNFAFTEAQLNSIKNGASLSKMFCQNFNLSRIHQNVFRTGSQSTLINCEDLPEIDLSLWKLETSESGASQLTGHLTIFFTIFTFISNLV